MKINCPVLSMSMTLAVVFLTAGLACADTTNDPGAAVQAFNDAITNRDQDTAIAQLADDGVQFTLRSLHDGVNPEKMVAPIATHWTTVIPVLLGATSSYSREIEILSNESHGDIATIWTKTNTVSARKGSDAVKTNEFTEFYLLIKTPDAWKIASIANNRQATKIEMPIN